MKARRAGGLLLVSLGLGLAQPLHAQDTAAVRIRNDSVSVRFVDADVRAVIQALSPFLDRPLVFGNLNSTRVTLETPRPVPRSEVLRLLRGIAESQNLEFAQDSGMYRVRPREAPQPVPPGLRSAASGEPQLTVVRLRHARATDIAATLAALYGASGGDLGGGTRPGTLSEELRRNQVAPYQPTPTPTAAPDATRTGGSQAQRGAVLESSVTVVPDAVSNALLIRATPHDAALLQQAVEQLDVRPLQVLIEVVIVEARRDHEAAWGLNLSLPRTGVGHGPTTVEASQLGGGLGDFVLHVMHLGKGQLDAVLQAGSSRGDVHILSRPVILAANNQEARILVGSQRPFVQVSRSLPTDTPTRDQVVQYKDVGTRLTVRPTISSDGYVMLQVQQEVDAATTETAFDAPVISTREAATQLLVKDSQTVVIGGLVDRQQEVTGGGIPLLSDLPLIGGLFGRQDHRTTETELFLFLTPRVLRTDADVEGATRDYEERAPSQVRQALPPPDSTERRRP